MVSNKNSNDLLYLGSFILIVGLFLFAYSIISYNQVKDLNSRIDFEELLDNRVSFAQKYQKHSQYAQFLMNNLEKYKNLPIKNAVCTYMDFAQNNAVMLYSLTSKNFKAEDYQKYAAINNIKALDKIFDKYKTCKKYSSYKQELANLIEEDKKAIDKELQKKVNMDNFLNSEDENIDDISDSATIDTTEDFRYNDTQEN